MNQIYNGANSVLIWLGRTGDEEWLEASSVNAIAYQTDPTFAFRRGAAIDSNPAFWQKFLTWSGMNKFDASFSKTGRSGYSLQRTTLLMRHLGELLMDRRRERDSALLEDGWAWVGFVDIISRPYFQRRWTIQERCVALKVHFLVGDEKVEWKLVQEATMALYSQMRRVLDLELPIPQPCGTFLVTVGDESDQVFSAMVLLKIGQSPTERVLMPLLELMRKCKGTRTKESQDRIYALLSLATEKVHLPAADYDRSVADVFTAYMTTWVKLGQGPWVLHLAGHRLDQAHDQSSLSDRHRG